jgi:hypothetical protein
MHKLRPLIRIDITLNYQKLIGIVHVGILAKKGERGVLAKKCHLRRGL